ncbi:MAG: transglutaminase domain-containing protein, partial [Clostridiales bacterium]|nr:transglutaminase domain-containing protein [Clostridiales bacterium]
PEKASDVRLNQETVLVGQKLQFQLISDRYDTSQVKLTFSCAYSEVAGNGLCKGIRSPGWGSLDYSYGSFKKSTRLTVYSPENIVNEILTGEWYGEPDLCEIYAGTSYKVGVSSDLDEGEKFTPSKLRKQGISLLLDGEPMPDSVVYTAGKHVIEVASGSISYKKEINVTYNVKDVLIKKDAVGYAPECKEVFDKAFSIVDQIITEGMSEDDKVKAIHDYLIYHADYVNNGDYSSAENWAYGASGVLLHGEGVCQSYAFAFYMMATAAGLECEVVSGQATNSTGSTGGHAWNRVKVNGTWYYIDCTWDDPVGGGYERYDYYLSKNGWSNHIIEESKDLALDGKYYWEHYYLTGKDY